jgi:hypothetical protein
MPETLDNSRRIAFTGAAGGIGSMTRPLLAKLYPGLVLSDRVQPKDLQPGETFVSLPTSPSPTRSRPWCRVRTASSISAALCRRARGIRS